jgi:hypothetical protein
MTADNVATHLQQLEEELLRPDVRRDAERIAALIADEFREFGTSGRIFDRTAIITELLNESPADLSLTSFLCQQLAPDVALVTYRSQRADAAGTRHALRSSVWVNRDGRWQILFHQGTRI